MNVKKEERHADKSDEMSVKNEIRSDSGVKAEDGKGTLEFAEGPGLLKAQAIEIDKEELMTVAHEHHIKAFNEDFCMLICHKTAYRRISLHIVFPPEYPHTKLHIEAKSDLLPTPVVKTVVDAALAKAQVGRPHLATVYAFIDEVVHENKLLYAVPEVRKIRQIAKEHQGTTVRTNEVKGTVRVAAKCKAYELDFKLIVPDGYPAEQIDVQMISCNFPESIWNVYVLQGREIARKISIGIDAESAVRQSTTMTGQPGAPVKSIEPTKKDMISSSDLKGIKEDIKFLKQATDLRAVDQGYNKQLHLYDYSTNIRRAARRELKKRSKEEIEKEQQALRIAAERLEKEQMEYYRCNLLGISGGPGRALRVVCEFLLNNFIFRLPLETSPLSGNLVFPSDPATLIKLCKKGKIERPIRVPSCGCYFKYSELDEFLKTPPFLKPCPREACNGTIVQHPEWTSDIKKLEKAWAMKKAHEREVAEVADMFGFGLDEEFTNKN